MTKPSLSLLLAAALSTVLVACKQHQAPKETPNPLDHVDSSHTKPVNFLHKTFIVKKYAQFPIEVPAHTVIPRVHGNFKSFVPRPGDDNLSDSSTDVGFLLMNADQFADYSGGHGGGTALYTVEATHDHEVEFLLPPTQDDPAKYYVVFFNAPGGASTKTVTADFTLSFGY